MNLPVGWQWFIAIVIPLLVGVTVAWGLGNREERVGLKMANRRSVIAGIIVAFPVFNLVALGFALVIPDWLRWFWYPLVQGPGDTIIDIFRGVAQEIFAALGLFTEWASKPKGPKQITAFEWSRIVPLFLLATPLIIWMYRGIWDRLVAAFVITIVALLFLATVLEITPLPGESHTFFGLFG
jgi:hypothetical protein